MKKFWFLKAIILGIIAITGVTFALMFVWNGLIPDLFKGPLITFPQALGLLVLSKILFHGFGCRGGHHWKRHQWKERMQEKMSSMTPEEREKFREQWKQRCGRFGKWDEPATKNSETKTTD